MTDRLYYNDSAQREFDAIITRSEPRGERQAIWLDRTLFYPTTGGQPFDTGTIRLQPDSHGTDASRVVDVFEEAGDIVHLVEGADIPLSGGRVTARIDWTRRFDHMQQHTGQHVLSAAFVKRWGVKTVSFHLGSEASTIDLERETTPQQIAAAEDDANAVVWEDRAVAIRYASADDAASLPLRKESTRSGTLRLIDIDGWDLSACGGTHVTSTGAVGLIAVAGWERFKGGQRIEFVCGGRALARLRQLRDITASTVRLLSTVPADIPAVVERLQTEQREQKRMLAVQQTALAGYQADELAASAEPRPWGGMVIRTVDGDAAALKALASAIVSRPALFVVLVSSSAPALVVAARSSNVPVSCADLIRSLTARFGGKGGGKPDLAQAGGIAAESAAIVAAARDLVTADL
jgi:alanyl-tRNA synthetase